MRAPIPARCARERAATATTGSCTAARCGSRTARSRTSRSSGRRPTRASAGSSSRGAPKGFTTQDIHRKLSLRASVTSELLLDDVRLPASALLEKATSLRAPLSCLNEARYGIVWGSSAPHARATRRRSTTASRARRSTEPIASFQIQQHKLAMMALEVNRASLLALHLGRMKDEGRLRPEHVRWASWAT